MSMSAAEFIKNHQIETAIQALNEQFEKGRYAVAVWVYEGRITYGATHSHGTTDIKELKILVQALQPVVDAGGIEGARTKLVQMGNRDEYDVDYVVDLNYAIKMWGIVHGV
ncbi:hypothetical protein [Acinetobacter proteolyticus]|uniref:Uncharacterized protein n=1 Tax=Acinetobacter proteolyticus TaxID=1776741 RepID=A0A2N0WI78_9GAMM|nr:hypothetical protein [Acinetobacter proteolyticus]PKF35515.1 hypothetical protein CW311_04290 [Acinetobacter proteolyticus]